ncbi:MAG TPA: single-stranded-DNA-specific exonuclease RecJ [Gemmatimonadales bacterium]|nr:single-stranded-DNA-specific exonuclease RecJ [Gemmatimonadales bacterium]
MTLPLPRWVVEPSPDPGRAAALAALLTVPEPLARILVQRGLGDPDAARAFLRPALEDLSDPGLLPGIPAAVEAITTAVRAGEAILVHGDYDVDGQAAVAILTRALRLGGAKAEGFVPHRLRDGYDFGPAGLRQAEAVGARLIITCDCGITAVETVSAAAAAGIRVVITDHHLPGPLLPPATAIVNPQCSAEPTGLEVLCGAGIAFKLVQALVPTLGLPAALPHHLLDYVALATVADVVPLTGENRILVRHGLRLLRETRWAGLRALISSSGLGNGELKAGQVGFILAPRLNAAGRIGEASEGLRLLLTDDEEEARILAERLARLNQERQALDQRILDEAIAQVEAEGSLERRAGIVLGAEEWHPGVVGIVASRVVERYGRPAFLVGFDGDIGKGSGRSISRFDLHDALGECSHLLERFGGHRMAAGVTVRRSNFEAFRERFEQVAAERLGLDELGPEQRVDLEVKLPDLTDELERLCRHLEPCGMGNPAPVFGMRGVGLTRRQRVGLNHLRGWFEQAEGSLGAIAFQQADRLSWLTDDPVDAAFRLEQNEYRGMTSLQARILCVAPHRR